MKDIAETVLTANAFVELYNFLVSNQCTQASQLVPFVVKLAGAVKKGDLTATAKAELLSRYCRSAVFKTGHYEVDHPLRIRTRPERADFNVYFAEVAGWFFGKRISLIPIRWKTINNLSTVRPLLPVPQQSGFFSTASSAATAAASSSTSTSISRSTSSSSSIPIASGSTSTNRNISSDDREGDELALNSDSDLSGESDDEGAGEPKFYGSIGNVNVRGGLTEEAEAGGTADKNMVEQDETGEEPEPEEDEETELIAQVSMGSVDTWLEEDDGLICAGRSFGGDRSFRIFTTVEEGVAELKRRYLGYAKSLPPYTDPALLLFHADDTVEKALAGFDEVLLTDLLYASYVPYTGIVYSTLFSPITQNPHQVRLTYVKTTGFLDASFISKYENSSRANVKLWIATLKRGLGRYYNGGRTEVEIEWEKNFEARNSEAMKEFRKVESKRAFQVVHGGKFRSGVLRRARLEQYVASFSLGQTPWLVAARQSYNNAGLLLPDP